MQTPHAHCHPPGRPATPLVLIERHPVTGRMVELVDGATLGRAGCHVRLADPEASRLHAVMRDGPGGPSIEDLGSRNGTWVNDRRIDGRFGLRPGDVMRLGRTVWHVRTRHPSG